MISATTLSKSFTVHKKEPGLVGSLRSLFRREMVTKHAVRDITFEVGEGEIVGLIGANGAGKTTLVDVEPPWPVQREGRRARREGFAVDLLPQLSSLQGKTNWEAR